MKERLKKTLKFSREFQSLDRVKSEFTGSKLQNSLENFIERPLLTPRKGSVRREFRWSKVIEQRKTNT